MSERATTAQAARDKGMWCYLLVDEHTNKIMATSDIHPDREGDPPVAAAKGFDAVYPGWRDRGWQVYVHVATDGSGT